VAVKLNIGVSRKLGQPNYGSRQASIGLEVEIDSGLLATPEELQEKVRLLYRFADQAVEDELNYQTGSLLNEVAAPTAVATSQEESGDESPIQQVRGLTDNQLRAIYGLARRLQLSPLRLVRERFRLEHVEDLDIRQASQLIEELKSCAEGQ
jgi:hypothetical protein